MTWLIPWIALSLSLFWHYPTLQLVGCNSCLTNINFRHFAGISAHESLTKPVEPLPFCVWWIITWNPWTVAKFLLLMLFHVCCNIRLRIRFRIHIHHHRFWSTPSTRMSLCNCRWFLHCHGRERECVLSAISAAMKSVSVSAYVSLIVSASVYVSLSVSV